jgi:hypothetical protein
MRGAVLLIVLFGSSLYWGFILFWLFKTSCRSVVPRVSNEVAVFIVLSEMLREVICIASTGILYSYIDIMQEKY